MAELSFVGKSTIRNDVLEKVTGKAQYIDDFKLASALQLKFLTSPYSHAKIKRIDTSKAKKLPGVRAVVTGSEALESLVGRMILDQPPIAWDVVRFAGEIVAVVAAETVEIAEDALELIDVEYEELPAVFDVEEAIKPGCPVVIHPTLPNYTRIRLAGQMAQFDPERPNIFHHWKVRKGDVREGFREAELIVENKYYLPRISHCPMETARAQSWLEPDGTLNIRAKKQGVYTWRRGILNYVGLSGAHVRQWEPYIGGSFGGTTSVPDCIAGLMARKTGRPVNLVFTRKEQFTTHVAREAAVIFVKDGIKKDGTLVAREIKVILDAGAYSGFTPLIVRNAAFGAVATYKISNLKWDSYGVYTNNMLSSSFRSFGAAEINWALEQQMDIIAEKLDMDPVAFRRMNIFHDGDVNCIGEITSSCGLGDCLDKITSTLDWEKPSAPSKGPWRRGKGIAIGTKQTTAGHTICITLKVHQEGVVEVRHSACEMGQGVNTVLAQVVAESFGIPMEDVKIVFGDSGIVPFTTTTGSSLSTWCQSHAALRACQDAKQQIFRLASAKLGLNPDNLEIKNWQIFERGQPWKLVNLRELFGGPGWWVPIYGEILGRGEYTSPYTREDENGQSPRAVVYYSHAAHGVEVLVNTDTGGIKLEKIASACDMGYPINPEMCRGQMAGALVQGLSIGLYEEIKLDQGQVQNASLLDYKIPSTLDLPKNENCCYMEASAPHEEGPFGAKGFSEVALVPAAAALSNAVYNAIGVRIKELPVSQEKVWAALKQMAAGVSPR